MAILIVFGLCISGLIGYGVGQVRGRGPEGLLLGLFLGPIGWMLVAVGPDQRRKCPQCLGAVPAEASKCCHCGSDLAAVSAGAGAGAAALGQPYAPEPVVSRDPAARQVACPACGAAQSATPEEYDRGLRCQGCGVGFVPSAR